MLKKYGPIGLVIILAVLTFASGLPALVSFDALAIRYADFATFVAANPVLAIGAGIAFYGAATAISFPAAWLFTIGMGLIFGWALGAAVVVVGATLGAMALYLAARTAFADFFRARAGASLNKMAEGFRQDAVSYLLFLRLAPIFPFTLVNVVPAILGVKFTTFAWTTLVGIIPGTIAYAFAGEGLRSVVRLRAEACAANVAPCGVSLAPSDLVTPQVLIALALLGIMSLLPVVLKRWRSRAAASSKQ